MKTKITTLVTTVLLSVTNLKAQTTYNYYFGNIHSQTATSDGNKDSATSLMTTPLQAYNYAKASQHVDFYGISDHNHSSAGMSSLSRWHSGLTDANTANSDGSFVALYGQEWGVISNGGHVIIYGYDSLMGWDAGLYDVYVAQSDYATLFNKVNARSGAFAYLAHPAATDYSNLFTSAYNTSADNAIIGMAARSGPAFSTNTTYSDPSTSDYIARYNDALKLGYHVGIGLDHDTHYSVFGRQTAGRLVVLAQSLTRANILDAFLKMRIYSSDDWNTKVDFNIFSQPMGSIFTHAGSPTIKVAVTDPDAEAVSTIEIYYGVPGSGTICTVLGSNSSSSTYSITPTIANNSTYYYYAKITQADGDVIWTSPIWYTRNDNATSVPTAVFSTSSNSVCVNQSVTLTDNSTNSPTSWSWTMPSGTPSSSTLQNPTTSYSVAGTYTVTLVATNSGGSSSPVSKVITVSAAPSVTATSATVCAGQQAVITGSGATTYSWNTGVTTASASVTPSSTTVYTVTGTNSSGCTKSVSSTVTVNALPAVTVVSPTICSGQSASVSASGASTYTWSTGATTASISVSPTSTTNYTVTGKGTNGCSKAITSTVTVTANPTVSVSSSSVCAGQQAVITASGASTYSWNTGVTSASLSVTPGATTVYTVTGSNGSCTKSATTTVTVKALPTVSVSSATICSGQQASLVASGATTYSWNTGATSSATSVTPTSNTVYTVTGTNSGGCSKTVTATVTVNPLPNLSATSATVCSGQSATITVSGATSYTWNSGSHASSLTITPTANTVYTVTGSNSSGCQSTQTASVTVTTPPTITATSVTVCAGQQAVITATGATTYSWNNGATGGSITVTPTASAIYTVTGSNGNCSSSTTANVTVNSLPAIIATSATVCSGQSATITASGASTYSWSTGSTSPSISVSPTTNTTYTVTGNDANGCNNTTTANVVIDSNPTTPTITASGTTLTSSSSGGDQWYLNGAPITGATSQYYVATQTGTYEVVVTNSQGCISSSATVSVTTTGIASFESTQLVIYPNPSNGIVTLSLNTYEEITIEIVNSLGQKVLEEKNSGCFGDCKMTFNLNGLSDGVYLFKINSGSRHITKQILKQ